MIIKREYPPNIEQIRETFDIDGKPVVFTYGNIIYNPLGGPIPTHLLIHEQVHEKQQGKDPATWWKKYLSDPQFRLSQELEAYRAQYKFYKMQTPNRSKKFNFLLKISRDLSSEIYGKIISTDEAMRMIKNFNLNKSKLN